MMSQWVVVRRLLLLLLMYLRAHAWYDLCQNGIDAGVAVAVAVAVEQGDCRDQIVTLESTAQERVWQLTNLPAQRVEGYHH